jgi:dimethylargininase
MFGVKRGMLAITHLPSPKMNDCVVTYAEHQAIDLQAALRQHAAYRQLLADCGAEVRVLDVNLGHPDCVFVEDNAVVLDELVIVASLGVRSRRGETPAIAEELGKYLPLARIELPATLEGGDVLRVGRKLLVGASSRTNPYGIEALRKLARGYEVVVVPVRGCLHFKTACTALPDGRLLVNRAWVEPGALAGFELIDVAGDEPYAANVVSCGDAVCLASAHAQTAERLRDAGYDVHPVDLSEFAKADGGATCLSILLG